MFSPSSDGKFYLLDNQPNNFSITPNFLSSYSGGVKALGGNDTVIGSNTPNIIYGNQGDDLLLGGSSNDALYGGKGNDSIDGGLGNNLIYGNSGHDTLIGNRGNNTLLGGKGNDILVGGLGNDSLIGDKGDDTLIGGVSQNTLTGGPGKDLFVLVGGSGVTTSTANLITDFDKNSDKIGLTNGLSEADLTFQSVGNATVIKVKQSGAILGQVTGVSSQDLSGHFVSVTLPPDLTQTPTLRQATGEQQGITGKDTVKGSLLGNNQEDQLSLLDVLKNQKVTVSLNSTQFAPYLQVRDVVTGQVVAEKKDNTNAQVTFTVASGAEYEIVVISQNGKAGDYTLTTSTVSPPNGQLSVGETVNGDLSSTNDLDNPIRPGSFMDNYDLKGITPNQQVQITLSSTQFDTQLQLINAATGAVITENNESPNGSSQTSESQLEFTVQSGVHYVVRVTSFTENAKGNYSLSASTSSTPIPTNPPNALNNLKTTTLQDEATKLAADGTLDRKDMLKLFEVVKNTNNGTFRSDELADLKKILGDRNDIVNKGQPYKMPDNVWYLSEQVIKGLQPNTPSTEVSKQVDQWFLGKEPPKPSFTQVGSSTQNSSQGGKTTNFQYTTLSGNLYGNARSPEITGINQNEFGDCYLLAAVGATFGPQKASAGSTSKAVNDMIIDNGDGSYTVRFYQNDPLPDGTMGSVFSPNYVTVNSQVITKQKEGKLFGATPGPGIDEPSNPDNGPIWMPLLERAYAQWHEQVLNQDNGYSAIGNGGSVSQALSQVTGRKSQSYSDLPNLFPTIKDALDKGQFVGAGTNENANELSNNVIVGSSDGTHAYSITYAYQDNSGNPRIVVQNPWGRDDVSDYKDKGFTDLSYQDFVQYFSHVDITQS